MADITVFLATFNRLATLERTIASLEAQRNRPEIVLVDNATDDLACLALIRELFVSRRVAYVYRMPACASTSDVARNLAAAIEGWRSNTSSTWFAVSDADICFDGSSPLTLDAYVVLATELGVAAGPHLRIEKFPVGFPLRNRVLATESRVYHRRKQEWHGEIPFFRCELDTTFHLFHRATPWQWRRMQTVRVAPPYDAMHLDWYVDVRSPTESDLIYLRSSSKAGSWAGNWLRDVFLAYLEDPELAFALTVNAPRQADDLCNTRFVLAWFLQYGVHSTNFIQSARLLRAAIPRRFTEFWEDHRVWMRMIYRDDFAGLGWEK